MIDNQTMDYYVQPRHLYSHSRTCTCSSSRLCIRISILVAFLICYLLDHASFHEISALMTWFQCMSDISSHYGYLDPLYIFSLHGDHDPFYIFIMEILIYLYCMWRWPHMSYFVSCLFMAIVLLCIRDCYIYLQLCAEFDHCIVLIGWLVLPLGSSSLHFWDGLIMYFSHRMTPLTSHIRRHLLQLILPHMVDHTFMAFPVPMQTI